MEAKSIQSAQPARRSTRSFARLSKNGGLQDSVGHRGRRSLHPDFENPDVVVKFTRPDVDLLLANKAELLLALEQLTMEMLRMTQDEHSHAAVRRQRLSRAAHRRTAAERADRRGEGEEKPLPFHFSPMNSRERRIIHLALRNESAVRSESAGMGPNRQVVVYPADMPLAARSSAAPGPFPSARPPPVIATFTIRSSPSPLRRAAAGIGCRAPLGTASRAHIAERILRFPSRTRLETVDGDARRRCSMTMRPARSRPGGRDLFSQRRDPTPPKM